MKKGIVIAGFSGIGKTTIAKKYKNVIDLDASEYVYDDHDILHIPFEQRKGRIRKKNSNWPQNYIKAILEAQAIYDIILVWDREDIIQEYLNHDIEFMLCYPDKKDLINYVKRFENRGNTPEYIEMKLNQYKEKMILFKTLDVKQIVLSNDETLEDYLKKQNIYLIKIY